MGVISKWWNKAGLQLKLQILIQGFLIVILLGAQQWIFIQFEHLVLTSAEERARAIADGAINGLNTLMVTKAGEDEVISNQQSRALFIQKMGASDNIKEMRIVRSKAIDDENPRGLPQEYPVDDIDRNVLASGKTVFKMTHGADGSESLRTVMPFIAKKNFRTTNCLKCHGVEDGAVLGAASVTIDVKEDLATIKRINSWIWIGQILLQIVLLFVVGFIVRRLLSQLGGEPVYVIDIVKQISQGNLSGNIVTRSGDSTSLLAAMKQMQAGLRDIISGTLHAAETLAEASRQLAISSHKVLHSSERESSASISVASSVEEMTAQIGQISDNAVNAKTNASETGLLAKHGAKVVQDVISEMQKISEAVISSSGMITALGEQSHQISRIVSVIKEIADQTNLLALNASIEAARAGEQGRGFAVVADEVRNLAERTTLSTQEITEMVNAIQNGTTKAIEGMSKGNAQVNEGVQMVGHAGTSMEKIQEGTQKVLSAIGDISSSLQEQSSTSNLIAKDVEGIARMTEETSAIIQEVTKSADNLEKLAAKLKESAAKFLL